MAAKFDPDELATNYDVCIDEYAHKMPSLDKSMFPTISESVYITQQVLQLDPAIALELYTRGQALLGISPEQAAKDWEQFRAISDGVFSSIASKTMCKEAIRPHILQQFEAQKAGAEADLLMRQTFGNND